MSEHREESDQLPEEGPEGQVPDDSSEEGPREDAEESAGGAEDSDPDQATGHPENAG